MRLTAYCRGLVDAGFKEERKQIAARRDDELKRVEDNYRKAFAAAEAHRDEKLRKINEVYAERMVEVQTTPAARHARGHRRARPPPGRAAQSRSRPACRSSTRSTRRSRSSWRRATKPPGATMADRWREGMKAAAAELDAINREVDGYCPAWNDAAWADRSLPRVVPPVVRFGTVPLELAALAARDPGRRPLDGGRAGVVHLPRLAGVSRRRQPVDRDARRGPRGGAGGAPGVDVPLA